MTRLPDAHEGDLPNARGDPPSSERAEEDDIDRVLADTFPASDPPPWTLGVMHEPPEAKTLDENSTKRG